MRRLYVSLGILRAVGLLTVDVQAPADAGRQSWRLPLAAAEGLRALLVREGFDPERPIFVERASHGLGFFLTQD